MILGATSSKVHPTKVMVINSRWCIPFIDYLQNNILPSDKSMVICVQHKANLCAG